MAIEPKTLHPLPQDVVSLGPDLRVDERLVDDVGRALSGSLNLRRTALRLLTMIRPRLADWGMVVLPGDRPGALTLVGGDDAGFHTVISATAIADVELGRVLRTGGTVLRHVMMDEDTEADLAGMIPHPRLVAEAASMRPADLLAVSLTARGATIGALVIIRSEGRGFDAGDVAVAERVATSAAMALDSARLYEERGRIASVLQSSLRPPSLPEVDGARLAARYRPAAEHLDIGGDFYDVYGRGDDWLLSVGDVSGKGVEAAALTGRTRQSLRTACHFDRRPEVVLDALNTVLFEERTKDFVTVVCARMRREADGRFLLDVAAAGHPAPIVLRRDGHVEAVGVGGTAVGMIARVRYEPATVVLQSGDTILMFTDGVDEARGADGMYGVDRLMALLPRYAGADPEVLCEAIERDVLEYLDGRPHDDIALLAVTCGD
ncbi:SpoIIE family protein phosphatase [Mycobacterium yunnanensis]|uniref:SpoIIE family protein phosphatase n=1 Tax=Mycobacterium yunnanensis TaxID=368477 RepID=A0A9X2YX97_9MYCO|nr:GAF domain-containing SpoIIE family protein phosphatase [Mycobacterium yunnanensis]MCV7419475.1 SpoIIE family protein phosphatase [Mycobacterium yunnanensis]